MTASEAFGWDDAGWYRDLLQRLRYLLGPHSTPALSQAIAAFLTESTGLPAPRPSDVNAVAADIERLNKTGVCRLGRLLTDQQLAEIHTHLDDQILLADENPETPFAPADMPGTVNIAGITKDPGLSGCPHLLELSNHPDVLARVAGFLGAPPTVQYYTAWRSFSGRKEPRDAQFFHVDRNCYKFLKLFIYLTDVDAGSGPHLYVRGSADIGAWMRRMEQLQKENPTFARALGEGMNAVRKSDDVVRAFFGEASFETITGKAGEAFLVNTSGVHKGILPTERDRVLFQVCYSLLPDLKREPDPVPRRDLISSCTSRFGDAITADYLRYVNRVAVTDQSA